MVVLLATPDGKVHGWLLSSQTQTFRLNLSIVTNLILWSNEMASNGTESNNATEGAPAADKGNKMSQLLEYAKKQLSSPADWRDGSLVSGGALYLLGYLAWCIYAVANHLSLLPALSSQYIMAGVILVSFLFGIAGLRLLRARLLLWLDPNVRWKRLARWAILVALFFQFTLLLVLGRRGMEIDVIVFLATLLLVVPVPGWQADLEKLVMKIKIKRIKDFLGPKVGLLSSWWRSYSWEWFWHYYWVAPTMGLCVIGFGLVTTAFLTLPQQFGGVRPRCAYLDIDKNMTSTTVHDIIIAKTEPDKSVAKPIQTDKNMNQPEVRDVIIAPKTVIIAQDNRVERSVKLDVLFSGSDTIFVRPSPRDENSKPSATADGKKGKDEETPSATVFEISRKIVQTITWCD